MRLLHPAVPRDLFPVYAPNGIFMKRHQSFAEPLSVLPASSLLQLPVQPDAPRRRPPPLTGDGEKLACSPESDTGGTASHFPPDDGNLCPAPPPHTRSSGICHPVSGCLRPGADCSASQRTDADHVPSGLLLPESAASSFRRSRRAAEG